MTTAAHTRQGTAVASPLTHYLDESTIAPGIEKQALAFMAFSACIAIKTETCVNTGKDTRRPSLEAQAYLANKFGDDESCADELGFESTWMGLRADHNHIF